MDDVYVYRVKLPDKFREAVMTCNGGYTVYIDADLDDAEALKAYEHAMTHIRRGDCDWNGGDVQQIESEAHRTGGNSGELKTQRLFSLRAKMSNDLIRESKNLLNKPFDQYAYYADIQSAYRFSDNQLLKQARMTYRIQ